MNSYPSDEELDGMYREIRNAWVRHCLRDSPPLGFTLLDVERIQRERFDAWLNAERARAWQDGVDEIAEQKGTIPDNPYWK